MYLFQVVAKLGNLHNNTPFVLVDPVVLHTTYIPCYYNSIEKEYNVLLTWMKNRSPYSFALLRWEKSFEKKEVGTHWYIEMRTTVFAWEPSFKIITVRLKFQEKYQFNGGKGQRIYIVPKKNLKLLLNVAAKQFWKKTRFYSLEMYFVFHGNPHFLSLLYALFSNFLARCVKQSFSSSQCNGKSFLTFGPSDFVNRIATSWTNDRKFLANHCSKVAKWVDMGWTWMKSQWVKLFPILLLQTVFFTL